MRIVKVKKNFYDYQELGDLVELCEEALDGGKNKELRKILRNTNGIVGENPEARDPSKIVELQSNIRKAKEKNDRILSKNKSLFYKDIQKNQCLVILENIKILDKQVKQLDILYNQVIKTYSPEDSRWAAKLYLFIKKSNDKNIKVTKTKEEKMKYDNFKKFFNTLNNIKVSTNEDKAIQFTLLDLIKYCKRTISYMKSNESKNIGSSREGSVVNRYNLAGRKLVNTLSLIKNINNLISRFTNFNSIVPINSGSYNDLIKDLNNIIKQVLLNLKDIMGDSFKED